MKKLWITILFILLIIPVFSKDASYRTYYDLFKTEIIKTEYEENFDVHSYLGELSDAVPDEYFLQDKDPIILPSTGATWKINIPESGLYTFFFEYLFYPGNGDDERVAILVDGVLPFNESSNVLPARYFRNGVANREKPSRNSTIAPMPGIIWQERYAGDTAGRADYPMKYYLTEGDHEITLLPYGGLWYINEVSVASYQAPPTLEEYRNINPIQYTAGIDTVITLDGAYYTYQYGSPDAMIYMDLEADPKRDFNALGRWRYPGNGVIWQFEVEDEGFYEVAFRYSLGDLPLQEIPLGGLGYKGFSHSERLFLLDGKVPFKEAELLVFNPTDGGSTRYTNYWYLFSPVYKVKEYQVGFELFLERGKHTIEMVPNLQRRLPVIELLEDLHGKITKIETDYREALGKDPNPNLRYPVKKSTIDDLKLLLTDVLLSRRKVASFSRGSQVEYSLNDILNRLTNLTLLTTIDTGDMVEITRVKENLQRTINNAHNMPLNLDAILLYSPRNEEIITNERNDSFWAKLSNYFKYRVKI
ncbi:MAG: hypothetical protein PHD88_09060 [Firmicutes bacterium]|nr:hypothetical protein [Bacillota bacterium]